MKKLNKNKILAENKKKIKKDEQTPTINENQQKQIFVFTDVSDLNTHTHFSSLIISCNMC